MFRPYASTRVTFTPTHTTGSSVSKNGGSCRDGVPDSAFNSHWEDLSAKAKKVCIVLGSRTTSTYTLRYRPRSGMEGSGVGRCTSSSLPQQLPLLTLCFYRRQTPDRVCPSKVFILSLECFGVGWWPAWRGPGECGRVWCG